VGGPLNGGYYYFCVIQTGPVNNAVGVEIEDSFSKPLQVGHQLQACNSSCEGSNHGICVLHDVNKVFMLCIRHRNHGFTDQGDVLYNIDRVQYNSIIIGWFDECFNFAQIVALAELK